MSTTTTTGCPRSSGNETKRGTITSTASIGVASRSRRGFDGPRFYDADPGWRLEARLDRTAAGTGDQVTLATSTGKLRELAVAGELDFMTVDGARRLTAYRGVSSEEDLPLFVPFQDATSGTETYGAGRYLDVSVGEDDTALLDFNLAYNPSCAYSSRYDCPYPAPGNRLDLAVRAGEMAPFDH